MAKRKSRVAWGLAVCLALPVVGGVGQLINHHARLHRAQFGFRPIAQWDFGWDPIEIGGCYGAPMITLGHRVGLGPLEVSWLNLLIDVGR